MENQFSLEEVNLSLMSEFDDVENIREMMRVMQTKVDANAEKHRAKEDEILRIRKDLLNVEKSNLDMQQNVMLLKEKFSEGTKQLDDDLSRKSTELSNEIQSLKQELADFKEKESTTSKLVFEGTRVIETRCTKLEETVNQMKEEHVKIIEDRLKYWDDIFDKHSRGVNKIVRECRDDQSRLRNEHKRIVDETKITLNKIEAVKNDNKTVQTKLKEQEQIQGVQEHVIQTLHSKIDQILTLENKVNDLTTWKRTKTEADESVEINEFFNKNRVMFDDINAKIGSVQKWQQEKSAKDKESQEDYDHQIATVLTKFDNTDRKIEVVEKWQQEKTAKDRTLQDNYDKQINIIHTKLYQTESKIGKVQMWQEDKTKTDQTFHEKYEQEIATLNGKCDGHDLEITKTQERQKLTTTAVVATLNTTQDLVDGVTQKLDVCEGVWFDKGWFDEESCFIKPQQDCRMVLVWRVCQHEEGELMAYIRWDGDDVGHYMGMTTRQNDTCNGVMVTGVNKGQKFWIEVERLKGQARVGWCFFTGWVIS